MSTIRKAGYNQRLFSGGLRKWIHEARFHWLNASLHKLNCSPESVLELGCYDAKTIQFLPLKPQRYVGLDANWEKGLDIARQRWQAEPAYEFLYCRKPDDVVLTGLFDISVCMETLEHVPVEMVSPYLSMLANHTRSYTFITVPIEKGLVFAVKHLVKQIANMEAEPYSLAEYFYAAAGRLDKVRRREHKGFDYSLFIQSMAGYFKILDVSPYPLSFLPESLGFGVGIIGKPISTS